MVIRPDCPEAMRELCGIVEKSARNSIINTIHRQEAHYFSYRDRRVLWN